MNRIELRNPQPWMIAALVLTSGVCALIYQVGWLRELRLVFGGSTVASAVVLAIFMGGLGFGGLFWGRIADRHGNPLLLYALFEIVVALSAAVSPFLLTLVRSVYVHLGGSLTMGPPLSLLVRVTASAVVLGIPTFLMGGTLPAVARAVATDSDRGRKRMAMLYAINTLGGVGGVTLATFFLLELLGTRSTIWSGSLLNLLVGLAALALASGKIRINTLGAASRAHERSPYSPSDTPETRYPANTLSPYFVYVTAFLVGFSFFVMEMVWNRMLTPLLGGTVYSFGLIIAVVLTGIGFGGWLYSLGDKRFPATIATLAATLGLEALALATPLALGDRLAVLAVLLRPFGNLGFGGLVLGWAIVTICIVLPASLVAGFQFPLLVNLLGSGRQDIGLHTGKIYAWNTFGAIFGVLAGGLGLIRFLTAPGCWQATVVLLCLLGGAAVMWSFFLRGGRILPWFSLSCICCTAILLITTEGPTSSWRHTPIGAGGVSFSGMNRIGIRDWLHQSRRAIFWETDGIESSIGLQAYDGLGFIVNGKVDGNASRDANTQIMGPLIGAILHPEPKRALVIGLGIGASAGWLADIESVEQVDVMELEPAMLEVARRSSLANQSVLENRKVRMLFGDARESLMTSNENYDIIFSEPSNPYRAGIASLYTREYYQAVAKNLQPSGYFCQWVQAYDVDTATLYVIAATLASVFEEVEVWQSSSLDLIFVCSKNKLALSVPALRDRLRTEPFKSAMMAGWGINGLEGFLAAKLSGPDFARTIKDHHQRKGLINSDDRMLVEFGFARSTGLLVDPPSIVGFRQSFKAPGSAKPAWAEKFQDVDWNRVNKSYAVMFPDLINELVDKDAQDTVIQNWGAVYASFLKKDYPAIIKMWQSGQWQPVYPLELAIIGEATAEMGDENAMKWADKLSEFRPVEAKVILGRYFWRKGEVKSAYQAMEAAFVEYRENPWPQRTVMEHALDLVAEMALSNKEIGAMFYALLREPFSVYNLDDYRKLTLLTISTVMDCKHAVEVFGMMEPNVPFKKEVLEYRVRCYEETGNQWLRMARLDLQELNREIPAPFTGEVNGTPNSL